MQIGEADAFRINVDEAPDLFLYKLKDKSSFRPIYYSIEFFPVSIGMTYEGGWTKGNLYSYGIVSDHNVISPQGTCTFIYGPYKTIKPGKYNINFYYSIEDSCDDVIIGVVDVCAEKGKVIFDKTDMLSNQGVVSLHDIEVLQEYSDAEVRITTFLEGIQFDKVVIQKIE